MRRQPCASCGATALPIEPHHHTHRYSESASRGRQKGSRRSHDRDAFPLCVKCHRQFHDERGSFAGWTKLQRRQWQDAQVALHQKAYDQLFDPEIF